MTNRYSSVVESVAAAAKTTPQKTAIVVEDVSISYSILWKAARSFADLLRDGGVVSGDRVLLRATHSLSYVAAYLGTTLISAIAVPYETDFPPEEVNALAERVEATCIYGGTNVPFGFHHISEAWVGELGGLDELDKHPDIVFPDASDIAELLLTTGTTGTSKVVTLTHAAVGAVIINIVTATGLQADNVSLVPMPLNHVFALRRLQSGLSCGATVVLIPGVASLKRVFSAITNYSVTSLSLVPSALAYIKQTTKDYLGNFASQIRFVESSSAPLPTETRDWLRATLPHSRLYNSYGCTESTACCMLEYSKRSDDGSCVGVPCVTAAIKIVDRESGEATQEPGRVTIGGGAVMEGYWGDPDTTASTLIDGFVLTNDLGYMKDGELYVLGRLDDVAIIGGHNVSPSEVEDTIISCDQVLDCACVKASDNISGDRLVLFVVWEGGCGADENERLQQLRSYMREHLEGFKVPSEVHTLKEIPRTYNGKIDRKVLHELAEKQGR